MAGVPQALVQRLLQLDDCGRCLDDMMVSQQLQQPRQVPVKDVVKQLW